MLRTGSSLTSLAFRCISRRSWASAAGRRASSRIGAVAQGFALSPCDACGAQRHASDSHRRHVCLVPGATYGVGAWRGSRRCDPMAAICRPMVPPSQASLACTPPPTRLHACLHCSGPQCSTSRGRHPLDDRVITRPRVLLLSRWGRYMSEAVGLVASPRLVHTASLRPATMSLRGRHSETARTAQLRLRYLLCTALRSASGRRLWASQLECRAAFWCARNVSWTGLAYQAGVGGLLSSAVVGHILVRATLVQLRCSPGASASPRGDGR